MATTLAIAGHKGGIGKTVTAMAVSAALARRDSHPQTLLIDLDPQGHCALGLGVELSDKDPSLRDLFTEPPQPIERLIHDTHIPTLKLIPSTIRLARVTSNLYMRPRREELLKRHLSSLLSPYQFIVIDCPPSLGVLTEMGIAAADTILIPCQMEARAADSLVDLLEVIGMIKGESFQNWHILLTRVDPRKSVTNQAVRAALATWQDKIFTASIPQSEPLNQAQIARTDIFNYEPKSPGALAYQALAQELLHLYGNQ